MHIVTIYAVYIFIFILEIVYSAPFFSPLLNINWNGMGIQQHKIIGKTVGNIILFFMALHTYKMSASKVYHSQPKDQFVMYSKRGNSRSNQTSDIL